MTARLATLAAVVLTGCFQTDAVLSVHPDGSATLAETVTVEGVLGLGVEVGLSERRLAEVEGARRTRFEAERTRGALVLRSTYAVDDVSALRYDVWNAAGVAEAVHNLSRWAGVGSGEPVPPSAVLRFARDGRALRVTVPERTVRAADLLRLPGEPAPLGDGSYGPSPDEIAALDADERARFDARLAAFTARQSGEAFAAGGTASVRFAVALGADTTAVVDARFADLAPDALSDADAFDTAARSTGFGGPGRTVPAPGVLTLAP